VREHSLAPTARHVSNKLLSRQRELFDLSSDHVEQARPDAENGARLSAEHRDPEDCTHTDQDLCRHRR
jgi:hypothetical protein